MNIAVFGAGYVGCVTAVCLARFGHKIWLVEISPAKLQQLKAGQNPMMEPGLAEGLSLFVASGQIVPLDSSEEAIQGTTMALVCVGTPSLPDGRNDIRQVKKVLEQMAGALKSGSAPYTLVLRSTLPYPQIQDDLLPDLARQLNGRYGNDGVSFALNPEFLREGSALKDFVDPPFVVVGTEHPRAAEALKEIYRPVKAPFHLVSLGTASLLKYACNAFHAAKVVFANEIASLAALFGADPAQTMEIFCQDRLLNISPAYLRPAYAFGGSCLPKDLRALQRLSAAAGISCPLLSAASQSNAQLIEQTVHAIGQMGVRRISLIGLTFKAETDDFRESPLVELAERLLGKGYALKIFDPDIDMRRIHGQNLRYIEQHMQHLASLLSPTLQIHIEQAELLIIGKALRAPAGWLAQAPQETWVLDLARQFPADPRRARLVHLEDVAKAHGPDNL